MATPVLTGDVTNVDENGSTTIDQTVLSDTLDQITAGQLSDTEIDGILYMREEEKLARDVYLTLSQQWELPIFQNIAGSEATHMEAVSHLLDRYGLTDQPHRILVFSPIQPCRSFMISSWQMAASR